MGNLLTRLKDVFFQKSLEICLVGLENSGKTTFCNQIALGKYVESPPTVGLNVKIMTRGNVTCKIWDIGGQAKYRSEWARYTRGCNVIVFVVDTQCPHHIDVCRKELHQLLDHRELTGLPLLVLANKIDLGPKFTEEELIKGLNLDYVLDNPWMVQPISAKYGTRVEEALEFLISHSEY